MTPHSIIDHFHMLRPLRVLCHTEAAVVPFHGLISTEGGCQCLRSDAGPSPHTQLPPRTISHYSAEFSTPSATGLVKRFSTSQPVSFSTSSLHSTWAMFLSAKAVIVLLIGFKL